MAAGVHIKYSCRDMPTIQAFMNSNAFIRCLLGPFGSGKSSGSVAEIVRRGLAQRPGPDGIRRSRWAVVRNTFPELRETTMRTVFQWLPPAYFGRHYVSDHRYVLKAFPGAEIEILFIALDRPEDVNKLLSLELTGAWVNEAREVPWAIIEVLQGRVGRFPAKRDGGPSWYGIWLDTNPPDAESKMYNFFESGPLDPEHAAIFKQPSGLSPEAENLENLPGGREYYVKLAKGKTDEWIKVYVHGDYGFVMDGKPVFSQYNDRVHCRTLDPIPGVPIYRGWDYGLTPACGFSQVLPNGTWLIFDELVSENMGIQRFGNEVVNHCTRAFPPGVRFEDFGDPAGEQRAQTDERTCREILATMGVNVEPGLQSEAIRLESIREPLGKFAMDGEPMFALHPRCKVTRKGFQGGYYYRRVNVSGERYTEKPEKNRFSHIMDANQYVATRLFGGLLVGHDDHAEDDDFPDMRYDRDFVDPSRSEETGY